MKRKVYLPITIVLAIGLIVLVLVLNKQSTTAKTEALLAEESAVAVRTEVVSESDYTADFTANGLVEGVQDLSFVSSLGGRVVSLYADGETMSPRASSSYSSMPRRSEPMPSLVV